MSQEETAPALEMPPDGPSRWGIVVVHGVGETVPGKTLNELVPAFLKLRGLPENTVEERRNLKDENGAEYPLAMRRVYLGASEGTGPAAPGAGGPRQAIFGEVYWADLSRCGDTPWDLVVRLFTIIFRVYYLTQQAARLPGIASWLLRLCLYGISGILCGPIAAVNGYLLLFLLTHGTAASLGYDEVPAYSVAILGLVGLSLSLLLMIPARRAQGSYPWSLALVCMAVIGIGLGAAGILEERKVIDPLRVSPDVSLFLGHFEFFLLLNRWLFLAVGALTFLALLFWLWAVLSCLSKPNWRRYIPGLTAGLAATLLQLGLWVTLVPALAFVGLRLFLASQLEGPPFDRIWGFFLFNLSAGLVVVLAGLLVWVWRWIKIQMHAEPPKRSEAPLAIPRILVHPLILAALILTTLVGIGSFASTFIIDREPLYYEFFRGQLGWFGPVLVTLMAMASLGVFYKPARNALHILMDVISHFHRASVRFPMPLAGRKESKALPKEDAIRDYFIQERIEQRLIQVIREVLKAGDVTHLTVIAHSQGSMIAVDTLWFTYLYKVLERAKGQRKVYLVTLGSPVTHLYQHYFPWRYGPLFPQQQEEEDYLQPWGEGLRRNLDGWINLFRVNDFIGRNIEGLPGFPDNVCFPKASKGGGHSGYWGDQKVLEEMEKFLPG